MAQKIINRKVKIDKTISLNFLNYPQIIPKKEFLTF